MLILLLIGLLVSGLITAYLNSQRGHSEFAGFVVGTILGPVGIVLALLSAPEPEALVRREHHFEDKRISRGELKKCPHCAESIRAEAVVCRYCGRDVVSEVRKPAPALSVRRSDLALPGPAGHQLALVGRLAGPDGASPRLVVPEDDGERRMLTNERAQASRMAPNPVPNESRDPLSKPRLFRELDDEALPAIDAGINLQRQERCHFQCYADWYELRPVFRRQRDHGFRTIEHTFDSPAAAEEAVVVQGLQEQEPVHIDYGRVFLTNRRLIFLGTRRNTTVQLRKILDFTPYAKGIEIQKDSGKGFFLAFTDRIDVFAAILGRAIERTA